MPTTRASIKGNSPWQPYCLRHETTIANSDEKGFTM